MSYDNVKIKYLMSHDGLPIVEINDYLVQSKYKPKKEAMNYVKRQYKPNQLNIVFGYGAGYIVESLEEIVDFNEKIIVVDPLLENNLLNIDDNKHKNILCVKMEGLEYLSTILNEEKITDCIAINVFCTNNYEKIFAEEYKLLLLKIRDLQRMNQVGQNTKLRYAEDWQRNLIMNLLNLRVDTSLENLKKYFSKPVVIASSGPSLIKQLDILKAYRKKVILLAAGSTTTILLKNNITPDFIASIDGGESNYEHFKDLLLLNSRLIYTPVNHFKVRESFVKQAFVSNVASNTSIYDFIEEAKLDVPKLKSGSTVANYCFSIAQYITTGAIAFIGQDMAFTDNLTHAKGHNHVKKVEFDEDNFLRVDGYNGEKVWTNPVMHTMKLSFENMIKNQNIDVPFFNCTEGGVKIEGFKQLSFLDFCEKYTVESVEEFNLKNYKPCIEGHDLNKLFDKQLIITEECIKTYNEAITILDKDSSIDRFKNITIKRLKEKDEKLSALTNDLSIEYLYEPIRLAVTKGFLPLENETKYQMFQRIKNQNYYLYKQGKLVVEKYKTYILEVLKRLEDEKVDEFSS